MTEITWRSSDGLNLVATEYGTKDAQKLPVICIPGLTRNARDFEVLAPWIASLGRRVIAVDLRGRGYLTVELQPAFFCPANMMCAQVMPETLKYAVAIQKIEIGNCQETIYSGVQDGSISDGLKIGITVIDNSTNTCPTFVALEGTEVTLTIQGGFLPINEEHRFGGQLLK